MARIALTIGYDGAAFDSYARQPDRRTVEGELLDLLQRRRVLTEPRLARFLSGSRTDKGVSAAGNVVAFDSDAAPGQVLAADTEAPAGLHLLSAARVPGDFNPRHADRRTYAYLVPPEWGFRWTRVRGLARRLSGTHDFTNFSRPEPHRNPRRTLEAIRYQARPGPPRLDFVAPSFGWQQVRRLVAALRGVSDGRLDPACILEALARPTRRVDLGIAPPENLILVRVEYGGIRFPRPPKANRARLERARVDATRATFLYGAALAGSTPTTRR